MIRILLSSCLIALAVSSAYCQRIVAVSSSATIRLEQDMTKEEARDRAREMAMITAIEEEFGVYVDSETNIEVKDGQVSFHTLGNTRLKGEWLKTNSERFKEDIRTVKGEYGKEYETWITVDLKGKIREVVRPIPQFEFSPLRCPSTACETYTFNKKDPFYLSFRSPDEGFLSVFMVEGDNVLRLFPYQDMGGDYLHYAPVIEDYQYILFSIDHLNGWDNTGYASIDELYMDTEKEVEFLKLVVVFSRNPIPKPLLEDQEEVGEEYILPKSLSRRQFDVWLQDNRIFDEDFFYKTAGIKIK